MCPARLDEISMAAFPLRACDCVCVCACGLRSTKSARRRLTRSSIPRAFCSYASPVCMAFSNVSARASSCRAWMIFKCESMRAWIWPSAMSAARLASSVSTDVWNASAMRRMSTDTNGEKNWTKPRFRTSVRSTSTESAMNGSRRSKTQRRSRVSKHSA
eukprot:Amastigsp_a339650_260.p3 type:complete len:159 gc:universal Amastigsp_a339650_260:1381-905(-)